MVSINYAQALEFLKKISSQDSVAIIADHDPDGFTSGILFYEYCKKKTSKVEVFIFQRGSSTVEDFNLKRCSHIITTDLAASMVSPLLTKYANKKILYMDHHPADVPLPKSVFEYRTLSRGYIPSARSAYELTSGKLFISLIGTISDAAQKYEENKEFLEKGLHELNMDLKTFQKEVLFPVSNTLIYFNAEPLKAFKKILALESIKDIQSLKEFSLPIEEEGKRILDMFESKKEDFGKKVFFFYFEPKYPVKPIITSLALLKENEDVIFIFVSPLNKTHLSISARNQNVRVKMSELLHAGMKSIEGSCGGHPAASGGTIRNEDLNIFKENIKKYVAEKL